MLTNSFLITIAGLTLCLQTSSLVKAKIFSYFSKSVLAANKFPATLQIIFGSVYGTYHMHLLRHALTHTSTIGDDTTIRLQQAAMSFVQWVFRQASDEQLSAMAPVILSGLLKLLDVFKVGLNASSMYSIQDREWGSFILIIHLRQRHQ